MDDPKHASARRFEWPPRETNERRLYPRLGIAFPVIIHLTDGAPPTEATAQDISLGGLRLTCEHFMPLFSRLALRIELPHYTSDGDILSEPIDVTVAVVRIEPITQGSEPSDDVDAYEVALAFTQLDDAAECVIGRFMLQMLLVDPSAALR